MAPENFIFTLNPAVNSVKNKCYAAILYIYHFCTLQANEAKHGH